MYNRLKYRHFIHILVEVSAALLIAALCLFIFGNKDNSQPVQVSENTTVTDEKAVKTANSTDNLSEFSNTKTTSTSPSEKNSSINTGSSPSYNSGYSTQKKKTCYWCGGSGRVMDYKPADVNDFALNSKPCPKCNGTGYLP